MPPTGKKLIGRQMLDTLRDVTALIADTNDPDRVAELSAQRANLITLIGELVDKNLDAASQEYKTATAALASASDTIRQAIKGMESVAKAIAAVGKALELVAKVAALA